MTEQDPRHGALLSAAASILSLVRDEAAAAESAGHLSEAVLSALVEHRMFRFWIPRSLGGEEIDLVPGIRVIELLASADGATAWAVVLGAGAGRFAAFFDSATAREIFGPPDACVAGSSTPSGIATEVADGYRVTGRWRYGSGAHHATWFTVNCVVHDGQGRPRSTETGEPLIRSVAVPSVEVVIHRTWSVAGMRGTGSEDFEIIEQFVPASRFFSLATDQLRETGLMYQLPFMSVAELSFAAVALGIARHALEEFAMLAGVKKSTGSDALLRDDADARSRYARAEAAVRSGRAFVYRVAEQLWNTVAEDRVPSEHQLAVVRLAAVDATARCAGAVDLLYERAGMTPLFMNSALGRTWRDIHAATQNRVVGVDRYPDVGRTLMEND